MLYHILSAVGWDPEPLPMHSVHDLAGLHPEQIRGLVERGVVKPLVGTPVEQVERLAPYAAQLKAAGILTDAEFNEVSNDALKAAVRWQDEEIEALKRGPQTEPPQRKSRHEPAISADSEED